MILSKNQLQVAKDNANMHINYANLNLEVLKHIILETENFMEQLSFNFDEFFRISI